MRAASPSRAPPPPNADRKGKQKALEPVRAPSADVDDDDDDDDDVDTSGVKQKEDESGKEGQSDGKDEGVTDEMVEQESANS